MDLLVRSLVWQCHDLKKRPRFTSFWSKSKEFLFNVLVQEVSVSRKGELTAKKTRRKTRTQLFCQQTNSDEVVCLGW